MAIYFNFIGSLSSCKETEKFKPYERIENEKGVTTKYKFSARCGSDNHFISSMAWERKGGSKDFYSRREVGGKTENCTIKYEDRNKKSVIDSVPETSKFIIDVNPSGYVAGLEHLVDDFRDGSVTDAAMSKYKVSSLDEAKEALEKAKAGRQEYIYAPDFVEALKKFVESKPEGEFHISGEYKLNNYNGQWYSSFMVNKITRYVPKDDKPVNKSSMTIKMLVTNESINDENEEKLIVSGYVPVYAGKDDDGNTKYDYCPIDVVVYKSEETTKKIDGIISKLTYSSDDNAENAKEIGFVCRVHNGSDRVKLTYDMLSDEQKESVDCGLCDIEDIEKEINGAYGERKTDIEIIRLAKGYSSGAQETVYTVAEIKGESEDDLGLDDDEDIFGLE